MSNREATRDAWFRLLREASSAAGRSSGLQRDDFGSSHILQDPGKPCAGKPSPGVACTCRTDQRSLQCCAEYRDTVSPLVAGVTPATRLGRQMKSSGGKANLWRRRGGGSV